MKTDTRQVDWTKNERVKRHVDYAVRNENLGFALPSILQIVAEEATRDRMQELYDFVASSERTIAPTCLGEEILNEIAKHLTTPPNFEGKG